MDTLSVLVPLWHDADLADVLAEAEDAVTRVDPQYGPFELHHTGSPGRWMVDGTVIEQPAIRFHAVRG